MLDLNFVCFAVIVDPCFIREFLPEAAIGSIFLGDTQPNSALILSNLCQVEVTINYVGWPMPWM